MVTVLVYKYDASVVVLGGAYLNPYLEHWDP